MDEIYTTSQDPADHWENDVIESTRELLTGHYEIEITSWRGHQVKMTLTNRAGDARQMVSYDALWWLLLGPLLHRSYTTVSREVDYGVA